MKTKFKLLFGLVVLALTIGFTACEGDQGEIGPKGDTGAQGEQGVPGAPGVSGTDEAASFGNVELTISGFNHEDDAYTEVLDYKYIIDNDPSSSIMVEYDGMRHFEISREYRVAAKESAENTKALAGGGINTLDLSLVEEGGVLMPDSFEFSATILEKQEIFFVHHYFYFPETENNFTISNYSYDAATGALKFDFTYSFTGYTGEVNVTGKVNVIVYKGYPA